MKTISIEYILKNITETLDYGHVDDYSGNSDDDRRTNMLTEIIMQKSSDTGFGHLIESILERGFCSAIALSIDNGVYIGEGHHRFVAAILLGMDEIPYSTYGEDYWISDDETLCAHWNESDPYPIELSA